MIHNKAVGFNGIERDVWQFFSLKEMKSHKTSCENWKYCLKDAKKYLGQKWHDNNVRYKLNGRNIYKMYEIIGFEDNNAVLDYYWILKPIDSDNESEYRYELWNNHDFYKNVVFSRNKKKYN